MKPIIDEKECKKRDIDPISQEALDITNIKLEDLVNAPLPQKVWKDFVYWADQFKSGSGDWMKPILCGFNINNYDIHIINRLAKEGGQYSEKERRNTVFHPVHRKDIMNDVWTWTENFKINSSNSCRMDAVREWIGIDSSNSHNGLKDVLDGAFFMIKLLKLHRRLFSRIEFADSFGDENEEIKKIMKIYDKK